MHSENNHNRGGRKGCSVSSHAEARLLTQHAVRRACTSSWALQGNTYQDACAAETRQQQAADACWQRRACIGVEETLGLDGETSHGAPNNVL